MQLKLKRILNHALGRARLDLITRCDLLTVMLHTLSRCLYHIATLLDHKRRISILILINNIISLQQLLQILRDVIVDSIHQRLIVAIIFDK